MKYLRLFQNDSQYSEFLNGSEYIEPHVVMIQNNNEKPTMKFKKLKTIFPYYISLEGMEYETYTDEMDGIEVIYESGVMTIDQILLETLRKDLKHVYYEDYDVYHWELPENYCETHPIYVDGERVISCSTPNSTVEDKDYISTFDFVFENNGFNLLPSGATGGWISIWIMQTYLYVERQYTFDKIPTGWSLRGNLKS